MTGKLSVNPFKQTKNCSLHFNATNCIDSKLRRRDLNCLSKRPIDATNRRGWSDCINAAEPQPPFAVSQSKCPNFMKMGREVGHAQRHSLPPVEGHPASDTKHPLAPVGEAHLRAIIVIRVATQKPPECAVKIMKPASALMT